MGSQAACVVLVPWFDGFVVLTQIIQPGEYTMSLTILETAVHREPISQNQYFPCAAWGKNHDCPGYTCVDTILSVRTL